MLAGLLANNRYLGIGEFHIFGEAADSAVMRAVVKLADKHGTFLHAHADVDVVRRLFAQDVDAVILWAHSDFVDPVELRPMLAKYPNLCSDLAFRSEHTANGKVDSEWKTLFEEFPHRFMLGTNTFTPERWYFVTEHAKLSQQWLQDLPRPLAERIAFGNAEALLQRVGWSR